MRVSAPRHDGVATAALTASGLQPLSIQGGTKDRFDRVTSRMSVPRKEHQLDLKRPNIWITGESSSLMSVPWSTSSFDDKSCFKQFPLQDPGTASCLLKSSGGRLVGIVQSHQHKRQKNVSIAVGKPGTRVLNNRQVCSFQ